MSTTIANPTVDYSVARCFGTGGRPYNRSVRQHEGHGVTWKRVSGANLSNLRCPIHEGAPLYQTTTVWTPPKGKWDVIDEEITKAAAKAKRAAKAAADEKLIAAGTHKRVRDLQPGELVVDAARRGGLPSGKVVEVVKEAKGYRVVVSRQYEAVARGYGLYGSYLHDDAARIARIESLTEEAVVPGTRLVIVGEELLKTRVPSWFGLAFSRGGEAKPFAGWAVEQPQCVTEYWERRVRQLEERLASPLAPIRPISMYETQQAYEERKAKAAERAAVERAALRKELEAAQDRLALHLK